MAINRTDRIFSPLQCAGRRRRVGKRSEKKKRVTKQDFVPTLASSRFVWRNTIASRAYIVRRHDRVTFFFFLWGGPTSGNGLRKRSWCRAKSHFVSSKSTRKKRGFCIYSRRRRRRRGGTCLSLSIRPTSESRSKTNYWAALFAFSSLSLRRQRELLRRWRR